MKQGRWIVLPPEWDWSRIVNEPPERRAMYFRTTPPPPSNPVCLTIEEVKLIHRDNPIPVPIQRLIKFLARS